MRGDFPEERRKMVAHLRTVYQVRDEHLLQAMEKIPRHFFIPEAFREACDSYGDYPCPIGHGQTISQPFIVAYMTGKLSPHPGEKFLEIGTGSGYQAAVLAELGAGVFTMEIVGELVLHAKNVLAQEGYASVMVIHGDGYQGFGDEAPFDGILGACAPENVPAALLAQLKDGGRMILPVGGSGVQRLVILRKQGDKIHTEEDLPVRFVPMVQGMR